MPKGQVKNQSSRPLWVVEDDSGSMVAHKLAPGYQSPSDIDADGFMAADGTPVNGHQTWIKIIDLATATVEDDGSQLKQGCLLCTNVDMDEFGDVSFDASVDWGDPLD